MGGIKADMADDVRFLGFFIITHMKLKTHGNYVSKKFTEFVLPLYKTKHYLNIFCRKIL